MRSASEAPKTRDAFDADGVARRARQLMAELGIRLRGKTLQATGWRFTFDRARTRLGCCSYTTASGGRVHRKVISLSRPFSERYGWDVMEDVMRHEIAHALDVDQRGYTDHGPRWKAWAVECGADPTRLYEDGDVQLPPRYVAICPACRARTPYHRRPKRAGACAECCSKHNGGRFDARFRLVFFEAAKAPVEQLALF